MDRSSLEMVHWTISLAFGETLLTPMHILDSMAACVVRYVVFRSERNGMFAVTFGNSLFVPLYRGSSQDRRPRISAMAFTVCG